MSEVNVVLEAVDSGQTAIVEAVLRANDLPADDVAANPEYFWLAFASADGTADGDVVGGADPPAEAAARGGHDAVGVGGVEVHGSVGLLRSMVVRESMRGNGYGGAICEGLEVEARAAGVECLYLLTTTAVGFFEERGYERVDREQAPGVIRETTEFVALCPSSAACLRKSL